jgi:hypothetical protein
MAGLVLYFLGSGYFVFGCMDGEWSVIDVLNNEYMGASHGSEAKAGHNGTCIGLIRWDTIR